VRKNPSLLRTKTDIFVYFYINNTNFCINYVSE
jgi:hypothetical protein